VAASPTPSRTVPLLVGGGAPGVQRIAARHADLLGLTGFSRVGAAPKLTHYSADALEERLVFVRGLPRDRDEPLRFQALVQLLRVTDDRQAAGEALVAEWGDAVPLTLDEVLTTPFLLLGTAAEIAQQLHERTARFGIEMWTVFTGRPVDPGLAELASVAEALRR